MDIVTDEQYLTHYGTPRHSGRYPYGSGENAYERTGSFLDQVDELKRKGLSETEIAKGLGIESTTKLRALRSIAKNERQKDLQSQVYRMKEKGMSNVAIGQRLKLNESSVRALLNPSAKEKADSLSTMVNIIRDQVADKKYIDFGAGVANNLGISATKLNTAIAVLQEEGYKVHYVNVDQLGTGKQTKLKVLSAPGVEYNEVRNNKDQIRPAGFYSSDNGHNFQLIQPPVNVDSKRIEVKYGPDGGSAKDGVIEIRRNVDDLSLGAARYAQVRIAVDKTHYLKGMAMYADDLPDGVDIRFNTNKSDTGNKLDALKGQKTDDETNPFGAIIRQREYVDAKGDSHLSAMNIVNEEGDWSKWSSTLSSQVLSKQAPALAKKQLDIALKAKQAEYDELNALTNPVIKKRLLEGFADDADSSAVHLKAAALPHQGTHVILPLDTIKPTEIYAPNYTNGDKVVLIRYPHGGIFEIPELTVNNRQAEARRLIEQARDAVGIHSSVASRLSGADFDGDTVLVIPNNDKKIKTAPELAGLKGFDPVTAYPKYDGMKVMNERTKQLKMGDVSNLITDMTIQGAPHSEIVRAVRHSMVVIDAAKKELNWKQSAIDNGISELKKRYQGSSRSGAATFISRASARQDVPQRKLRTARNGGPIDPETGRKVYENIDSSYTNKNGVLVPYKRVRSTKSAETNDAYTLVSDHPSVMETVYADHANMLKGLANQARKEYLATPNLKYSTSARKIYDPQYKSLQGKLNIALKNAPLERQAQLLANANVKARIQANPEMDQADLKKIKGQALTEARIRVGAQKQRIQITPEEWNAIQAGAITNNFLEQILRNSDLDQVKKLATPRQTQILKEAEVNRIRSLANAGYTQAEIAAAIGKSTSVVNDALNEGKDE